IQSFPIVADGVLYPKKLPGPQPQPIETKIRARGLLSFAALTPDAITETKIRGIHVSEEYWAPDHLPRNYAPHED
ncbi:MAG: hypothetical protein M3Q00_04805, partial [Pseudomonadota bacterium]|nr:hypothetical protein [Pseudomonadota bacterium]